MGGFISPCIRMKFKNLLSLKSLIVLGFVMAVIPLFMGGIYAVLALRETSALGRTVNSQIFEQTKSIRLVLQKASDIERKARLFVLLSDPALRQPYEKQSYETARASFKQSLNELLTLHVDNNIALLVNELSEKENLIYQQIVGAGNGSNLGLPVNEAFQGLRESSNTLAREFESHVDQEFNALRQQSEALEQNVLLKGAVLLSFSFVFITILLIMLSRSMRQLDSAIRRLGAGELNQPIAVAGPEDVRFLGSRLEWLRTYLLELENSKQHFMHNVANEIEAPLTVIREGAELLASEVSDEQNSAIQDVAKLLIVNIEKMNAISADLLRYSNINTKPNNHHKQAVNMNDVLESVLDAFQAPMQTKSITMKMQVKQVEIFGVYEQLRNIVEQLIDNAIKYSPMNGEIRVMLRDSGAQMELEVEDEGPGINDEERPHIFEPFFRGKIAGCGDNDQGSGLGLAIVREFVANHQGNVELIDSRQDQPGVRIRVQIPLNGQV